VADAYIDKAGEHLYWLASVDEGYDLWRSNLRKSGVELYKKLGARRLSLQPDADESYLFLLGANSMKKMGLSSGKTENITYSARQKIYPEAEREYMYGSMVNEESERFYDPDMHGVDWKALSDSYRRFLPHISNNADFAEMASELLGELNVSHTGGRYYGPMAKELTGSLGLIYNLTYEGPGLKVDEIIAKGPFGFSGTKMTPGAVINSINGEPLAASADPMAMLNGLSGKKTLVGFTTPSGESVEEVVLPVSNETGLLYDRWVERNRQMVDSLSGGRLGYVHLQAMNDASYRRIYADVLGRYWDKEGIVIDTRWNGGGRLHEDIEVLFSGKKYLTQYIKGVKSGEMPSRRWLRPSVMVTCEANYSNAHGTPWMYRNRGLGKIVGMPVPGTMTSVNWVDMQDPSLVYGIPVVGFKTAEGNYLENTQLEPDVKVANDPATIVKGTDLQLEAAVRTLLNDIDR
ncbi:MAG: peptidase S41, partial [Duncaniella sp.]|nr:peptidase S41 [Duncaniella sp.]